jgi:hypothetical protein
MVTQRFFIMVVDGVDFFASVVPVLVGDCVRLLPPVVVLS